MIRWGATVFVGGVVGRGLGGSFGAGGPSRWGRWLAFRSRDASFAPPRWLRWRGESRSAWRHFPRLALSRGLGGAVRDAVASPSRVVGCGFVGGSSGGGCGEPGRRVFGPPCDSPRCRSDCVARGVCWGVGTGVISPVGGRGVVARPSHLLAGGAPGAPSWFGRRALFTRRCACRRLGLRVSSRRWVGVLRLAGALGSAPRGFVGRRLPWVSSPPSLCRPARPVAGGAFWVGVVACRG